MKLLEKTELGEMHCADSVEMLNQIQPLGAQLLFTSPPYRTFGDDVERYLHWVRRSFSLFSRHLKDDGSMVVVLGSDWMPREHGGPWQRVTPMAALGAIAHVLPVAQMFVVVHQDEQVTSQSVKQDIAAWVETGQRAQDVVEYAWQYGMDPKAYVFDHNAVIVNRSDPRDVAPPSMPVRQPEWFIRGLTDPGDLVLDPFAGSNSTGVAAEGLNRRWLSIEKDADRCSQAVQRLTKNVQS